MAKKLTKAEIAKNPTKAINSGKMKKKSGEVISPGKVAARLASKASKQEMSNYFRKRVSRDLEAKVTSGQLKVARKIKKYYDEGGRAQGGPDVAPLRKKGIRFVESMTDKTLKGKARKIFDTAQRTELEAKVDIPKRKSIGQYPPKRFRDIKSYTAKPTTPKVPVKPKASRTRSGKKSK